MMRSIFGHKSITHLIYGLLMMLPFFAIGVKCIYVSANKNSFQSFSGSKLIDYPLVTNTDKTTLIGKDVRFDSSTYNKVVTYSSMGYTDITNITYNGLSNSNYEKIISYDRFRVQTNQVYFYSSLGGSDIVYLPLNYSWSFDFVITMFDVNDDFSNGGFSLIVPSSYSYIDNVFDYSISEVIDENNGFVPKNDFVGLLNGVFSDSSDHLYLKLTNWYLNYALLISTIYILFLAMLWFVNLCRNILERSMNIGNGVD